MRDGLDRWIPVVEQIARDLCAEDAAHDSAHLLRVWTMARHLAGFEHDADPLILMPAALLHDCAAPAKGATSAADPSIRGAEVAARSACLARGRLEDAGYPAYALDGVVHAIERHSYSAGLQPETIEARLLQDADRLDALGAIGLARMFHVGGQANRPLIHKDDPFAIGREPDDGAFTLDHLAVKLIALPDSMWTEEGRRIALERLDHMFVFIEALARELADPDALRDSAGHYAFRDPVALFPPRPRRRA